MKLTNGGLIFLKPAKPVDLEVKEVINKCNTCNAVFPQIRDLKVHYKSEWHVYNIKRRSNDMQVLSESAFLQLKSKMEDMINTQNSKLQEQLSQQTHRNSRSNQSERLKRSQFKPRMCLFDDHVSSSMIDSVRYMEQKYSFYLPERENIINLSGLLGQLHQKIYEYYTCLYCEKPFDNIQSVLDHMEAKGHRKINDDHFEQISAFYDLKASTPAAIIHFEKTQSPQNDDSDWEDVEDDISNQEEAIKIYQGAALILENGNLRLPDGREAVHRELSYIYKQNLRPYIPVNSLAKVQNSFRFLPRLEKKHIKASQKTGIYRLGKRDLKIALKSYKLFVPRRQDLCFG
ncbi:bifunctional Zinc finger C2H2 superfamily/Zinc finger C2H2-type/Zinc finger protein 622-Rei1-Reh1/ZN622-Rei1-Reh1 [Babesia duncani]|uniref:Bifunctional Zinc finger C2H2 superfamily/Zinc finger C2H2-type/Zinc finger protein 622-Rei1-Reh1/ZN622-Rei1-Reh1 n=1 Tax=Babesia duncani TaxID=323732 RepID=A0AAD9UN09_9APIC|nr:bifunctional Zinc finger C2H2 superfamily/Zinc finger C2H2-type/Zinc finger protein 622-Rei1-Reh1/ZN622-Rei1-Reh1 [Babesia duncani]